MYDEWLGNSRASTFIMYIDYGMKNKKPYNICAIVSMREFTTEKRKGGLDLVSENGEKLLH